mmetsp:Transcript_34514/g.52807  ORF Transcript_34514/g.52807 Transcript_34514/m.52807 type:complete len:114 (+) Transcript_34514:280-621(+)
MRFGTLEKSPMFTDANSKYEGEIVNGEAHGFGRLLARAYSDMYEGQFDHGQPHGFGRFFRSYGMYYVGWWKRGSPSGEGIWYTKTGAPYMIGTDDLVWKDNKNWDWGWGTFKF